MVRLAYHSTGTEAGDHMVIEQRLLEKKKAVVLVSGFQDDVRATLEQLFGRGSVQEMEQRSEDPVTYAQQWQCVLHREKLKATMGARERQRQERRAPSFAGKSAQESLGFKIPRMLPLLSAEKTLTARQFADQLSQVVEHACLDEFHVSDFPSNLVRQWRRRFAHVWADPGNRKNMRGAIAEKILPKILKDHLQGLDDAIEPIRASDVVLYNSKYQVLSGYDNDQVLFRRLEDGRGFINFMEFDALYRTRNSEEYVAFDVTTGTEKKFRVEQRTQNLKELCAATDKDIVLIDVVLKDSPFLYMQMSTHMYRWVVPCTIDFEELVGAIVPNDEAAGRILSP